MVDLPKDFRLFQRAELEYITPFLKLWLAFNCWYKKDSEGDNPQLRNDFEAIEKYKQGGKIKHHFMKLFEDTSTEGEEFIEAIKSLVLNTEENYELKDKSGKAVKYLRLIENSDPEQFESTLIENPTDKQIKDDNLILVSKGAKNKYIRYDQKEEFFVNTLQVIYGIRCCLVHGDFDIDNKFFKELVEASYKILYPIMGRVLA